jgi:DNA mismatch repair protein MutH
LEHSCSRKKVIGNLPGASKRDGFFQAAGNHPSHWENGSSDRASLIVSFFFTTQTLNRAEAVRRINLLAGKDLRSMADEYKIPVWKNGRENKGWAGLVIERYLNLPQNSRQAPDFGDWELKVVPLRKDGSGNLRVKESMAITMIEPAEVLASKFEDSHLYDKLRSLVVVSRVYESKDELHSMLHAAAEFDLDDPKVHAQVRADYETIRTQIRNGGIDSVTGDLGQLVQARTKGPGHGSTSRAFYARSIFVAHILNLQKLATMPRVSPDFVSVLGWTI